MEMKKSVVAAITTAVHVYLQAQQEAAMAQQQLAPRPVYSPWAMAGRASAMEMRRTWQLRLVR